MILREKKELTKMLILIEILHNKKKIKDIAEVIEITLQGVSDYVKQLKQEGLIEESMNITADGIKFITEKTEELRDYISSLLSEIQIINITDAIAGEKIKKGEKVGLFIEDGYIYAYKKDSSSTGTALTEAESGGDIAISELKGILDLKLGKIIVVLLPNAKSNGTKIVDYETVKEIMAEKHDKTGAYGVVPYLVLKKLSVSIDFEFNVARSAIEAAHRGLDTIILVSKDLLKYIIDDLENVSKGFKKVEYKIVDLSTGSS